MMTTITQHYQININFQDKHQVCAVLMAVIEALNAFLLPVEMQCYGLFSEKSACSHKVLQS